MSPRPCPMDVRAALLCQQLAPLTAAGLELAVWSRKAPKASPRTVAPLCKQHPFTSGSKRCVNAKEYLISLRAIEELAALGALSNSEVSASM